MSLVNNNDMAFQIDAEGLPRRFLEEQVVWKSHQLHTPSAESISGSAIERQ